MFCKRLLGVLLVIFSFSLKAELPAVMIIHGFMGKPEYHAPEKSPLTKFLQDSGFDVHIAETPRVADLETHAQLVREQIERTIPKGKELVLIGHSQGGLVARLYTYEEHINGSDRVIRNVTTIGTPHRGTPPRIMGLTEQSTNSLLDSARPILLSDIYEFYKVSLEMGSEAMKAFNERVINVPGVNYASVSTVDRNRYLLLPLLNAAKDLHKFLVGPTDGLIPLSSSRWGTEIHVNGRHHTANHISQIYKGFGDIGAATDVGEAIGHYLNSFLNGTLELNSKGVFNYRPMTYASRCINWMLSLL